jgi:type VI secretion system secreted protein Hcp
VPISEDSADYFLKLDGIEGECADPTHKGELRIATFSKAVANPHERGAGMAVGPPVCDDVRFTMRVDRAYPGLLQASMNNQLLKKVVLTCRKAGKDAREYLKITLSDVMISSCRLTASPDSNPIPMVHFSLNFAQIQEEYRSQKAAGTLGGSIMYSFTLKKA